MPVTRAAARTTARSANTRETREAAATSNNPNSSPTPRQQIRRIYPDRACTRCHEQNIQCDDTQMVICSACIESGTDCLWREVEYTTMADEEDDEPLAKIDLYSELIRLLQYTADYRRREAVHRLRDGENFEDVVRYLRLGDLVLQVSLVPQIWYRNSFPYGKEMPSFFLQSNNPYLDSSLYRGVMKRPEIQQGAGSSGGGVVHCHVSYSTAKLCDALIDMAKPSEWTRVDEPDEVLRVLLKAYFLYAYPTLPFFHKGLFLKDMIAGRGEFCSSLLVNAVLAAACHACSRLQERSEFWNPCALLWRFSAEAMWERDNDYAHGTDSLTTVQGSLVMSATFNMNAADSTGWRIHLEAVAMAERMKLFEKQPHRGREMQMARSFTAWAAFCFQAAFSFHFFRPPTIKEPPRDVLPDPQAQPGWYPETWIIYPLSNYPIRIHHADYIKATAEFRIIMADIAASAFPDEKTQKKLSLEETFSFHARLRRWYQSLPPSLSIKQAILPHQLSVHLHYLNVMLALFKPFMKNETPGEGLGGGGKQADDAAPGVIALESKVQLETVWRLYYLRHGFDFYDPSMIHFHVLMGFGSSKTLSQSSNLTPDQIEELRSTMVLAGKGMNNQAKNTYIGVLTTALFKLTLDPRDLLLMKDYADIRDDYDDHEDRKRHLPKRGSSDYPINVVSIAEDPKHNRISNLLAFYKSRSISSEEQEAEESQHHLPKEESLMSSS